MKFSQLIYFEAVCRHKNFSKAAEELYVSQPAISSSIKELEDEFGVKLFSRINNKLSLTETGEYLLAKATGIVTDINLLTREMKDFGDNNSLIKVGTPPMIGAILFPEMYIKFCEQYPKIRMEILEFGSLKARSMVLDNTADIAIAIIDQVDGDELDSLFLFKTELVFCVSRNHHLANRKVIDWEDLDNEKLILMKEDSYQNELIKKSFAAIDIKPNVVLYSSQLYTIKKFISDGNSGAFLFREIAEANSDLVAISLKNPISLNIGTIWKRNSSVFKDVKRFITFMKNKIAQN